MPPTVASSLTLSSIAWIFKSLANVGTKEFKVEGLPILLNALRENPSGASPYSGDVKGKGKEKEQETGSEQIFPGGRRGIVTVCNHNSVLDDPTLWAMMPWQNYAPFASPRHTSRNNRWTMGASDVMFTKPLHSSFFNNGQVIETHRGAGIFQPAVDRAIKLLQDGEWIHVFPEGKVNQVSINPEGGLFRFKWGVGRIVMDSMIMPEVIPMWISGFDQLMPETRGWPKLAPRLGASISITIGKPITHLLKPLVDDWREIASHERGAVGIGGDWGAPPVGDAPPIGGFEQRVVRSQGDLGEGKERDMRIRITDVIQRSVQALGESVEEKEGRFEKGLWSQSRRRGSVPSS